MAEAGGYAPLDTTAGDEAPSALERIDAANKAARAERGSPLRYAVADQTPRMDVQEAGDEKAPLVEGEAARSDQVIVSVERDAVPDEQLPADEETVKDDKRRLHVRCCQSPEEIQQQVAEAGGNAKGMFAISLSWATHDDLDLHVIVPGGGHAHAHQGHPNQPQQNEM